jgi:hypothetical protein
MVAAMSFPPTRPADLPPEHGAEGELTLRYEDIAQDGRVHLTTLPQTFSTLIWSRLLSGHPITKLARAEGVLPILTKLVITGTDDSIPVSKPLCARGAFELAHAGEGEDRRLLLHIWVDLQGERGLTYGPPPPRAGEIVPIGSVYGEHVFTRPFAPRDQRRVTRFDFPGLPEVPPRASAYLAPATLLELPEGATPLEDALIPDAAPIVLGLAHTDSNQHVNSLVYPRLFEEAMLRRVAELGRDVKGLLMRRAELAYRRPCFAGERLRMRLRVYERAGAIGAICAAQVEGAPENELARCYGRVELA